MVKINYIGLKCGICGKDFEDNDDVVVCPDCGTPMHRSCYASNRKCPFEDKHSEGYIFEKFDAITASAKGESPTDYDGLDDSPIDKISETSICPVCGEKNKKSAVFCNKCGINLKTSLTSGNQMQQPINPAFMPAIDPLAGIPADTEFEEDVTAADLACYVKVNTPYYMSVFGRLKKKLNRFNFSAAIFSSAWFLYRKQYKFGGLILSINLLLVALRFYLSYTFSLPVMKSICSELNLDMYNLTMQQYATMGEYISSSLSLSQQLYVFLPGIVSVIQFVLMILFGVFGNRLYYRHCVNKIRAIKAEAKEQNLSRSDTAVAINNVGGVNTIIAFIFAILYIISLYYGI